MDTVYDWTAERSGHTITVRGRNGEGMPVRVTRVKYLAKVPDPNDEGRNMVVAVDESDKRTRLSLD